MQPEITIVPWNPNRLAVTGWTEYPGVLLGRLMEQCSPFVEYRNGPKFTFSFPSRDRRLVARIVEGLA